MIDFNLTDEQRLIRDTAREFAKEHLESDKALSHLKKIQTF